MHKLKNTKELKMPRMEECVTNLFTSVSFIVKRYRI